MRLFRTRFSKDFKTALEEKVFEVAAPLATIEFTKMQLNEWMKPISAVVPKALAASGHTATRHSRAIRCIAVSRCNGSLQQERRDAASGTASLVLGPDFPKMVRRNLEEERCGVVQALFQRVSQVTRAGQSNLAVIRSPKL